MQSAGMKPWKMIIISIPEYPEQFNTVAPVKQFEFELKVSNSRDLN